MTHTNVGPVTTVMGLGDPLFVCATDEPEMMLSDALRAEASYLDTSTTVSLPACVAESIAASHGSIPTCAINNLEGACGISCQSVQPVIARESSDQSECSRCKLTANAWALRLSDIVSHMLH